jgi:hypothetical protein
MLPPIDNKSPIPAECGKDEFKIPVVGPQMPTSEERAAKDEL